MLREGRVKVNFQLVSGEFCVGIFFVQCFFFVVMLFRKNSKQLSTRLKSTIDWFQRRLLPLIISRIQNLWNKKVDNLYKNSFHSIFRLAIVKCWWLLVFSKNLFPVSAFFWKLNHSFTDYHYTTIGFSVPNFQEKPMIILQE